MPVSNRKQRIRDQAIGERRTNQIKLVHIGKKFLLDAGLWSEAGYRAAVEGILIDNQCPRTRPEPSSADLDDYGLQALLRIMNDLGWNSAARRAKGKPRGRYRGTGARGEAGHLTQQQADYIAKLEDDLGWTADYSRLLGFIERQTAERKPVDMLRNREASDVITGLERLAGYKPHPRSRQRRESAHK